MPVVHWGLARRLESRAICWCVASLHELVLDLMVLYHGCCFCVGVEALITSTFFGCTAITAPVKSTEATLWIIVPRTLVLLLKFRTSVMIRMESANVFCGEVVVDVVAGC